MHDARTVGAGGSWLSCKDWLPEGLTPEQWLTEPSPELKLQLEQQAGSGAAEDDAAKLTLLTRLGGCDEELSVRAFSAASPLELACWRGGAFSCCAACARALFLHRAPQVRAAGGAQGGEGLRREGGRPEGVGGRERGRGRGRRWVEGGRARGEEVSGLVGRGGGARRSLLPSPSTTPSAWPSQIIENALRIARARALAAQLLQQLWCFSLDSSIDTLVKRLDNFHIQVQLCSDEAWLEATVPEWPSIACMPHVPRMRRV